jgi:hypothetical protein
MGEKREFRVLVEVTAVLDEGGDVALAQGALLRMAAGIFGGERGTPPLVGEEVVGIGRVRWNRLATLEGAVPLAVVAEAEGPRVEIADDVAGIAGRLRELEVERLRDRRAALERESMMTPLLIEPPPSSVVWTRLMSRQEVLSEYRPFKALLAAAEGDAVEAPQQLPAGVYQKSVGQPIEAPLVLDRAPERSWVEPAFSAAVEAFCLQRGLDPAEFCQVADETAED